MPRGAIAVALLLILPIRAKAACDLARIWGGAFRQTILDAAVDGDLLWVATSWGVGLSDMSVGGERRLRTIAIPGTTRRIAATGGVAWVASGSELVTVTSSEPLRVTSSISLGTTIQDLLYASGYLYAATPSGIVQLDLVDPNSPAIARTIPTTSGRAVSLARIGSTLYVAQGGATIDVIALDVPSIPQGIGTIASLAAANAVSTDDVSRLVVSDGRTSEVFAGSREAMARIASLDGIGASSTWFSSSGAVFIAGQDSTIRAVDLDDPSSPSILFEKRLTPSPGTSNRIERIRGVGDDLRVAAGDIGLVSFDLARFHPPFAAHGYRGPAITGVIAVGDRVWTSAAGGGIVERTVSPAGTISNAREWLMDRAVVVRDAIDDRLLVSEGGILTLWDTSPGEPTILSTATFPALVRTAVARADASGAWVILEDGTVWSAALSSVTAVVTPLQLTGTFVSLDRNGSAVALVEFLDSGSTRVRFYTNGELQTATPVVVDLEGFATSSVAIDAAGKGAAITFRGLSVIDFVSGNTTLAAGENPFPAVDLAFAGTRLVILRDNGLDVRDSEDGREVTRLEGGPGGAALAIAGSNAPIAIAGSATGLTTLRLDVDAGLPVEVPAPASNQYYDAIASDGAFVALSDAASVDLYRVTTWGLGLPVRRIVPGGGVVGVAQRSNDVCALYGSGSVRCFDVLGRLVGEGQLTGEDTIPLAIHVVRGLLWVSTSSGCSTGGCRDDVVVLGSTGGALIETARFDGRIVDIVVDGDRAYSLTELPSEIRVWDVSTPASPSILVSAPSEGVPVAIALDESRGTIYTLGSRVIAWSSSLVRLGSLLDEWVTDPSGRLSYIDQRMRMDGGCALISGRTFDPQVFEIEGALVWTPRAIERAASPAKGMVVEGGRFHILSEHGIEIFGSSVPRLRRRGVRR